MSDKPVVLIVDDEPSILRTIGDNLSADYKVIALRGRADTDEYFEEDNLKPDLILLDILMGPEQKEEGYILCQWLKSNEETRDIPVIFLTQKTEPEEEAKGFEFGAVDYITKPINPLIIKARVKTHIQLRERTKEIIETQKDIILTLSEALEKRSHETSRHAKRVRLAADLLAQKAGLSDKEREDLWNASPMHDIGKIGIIDRILNKKGSLGRIQFKKMKQHTTIGYEILKESKREILQIAAIVALQHHEAWDGSGYPQGKSGENIDILGRITCLADVFDAITHKRCYRGEKVFTMDEVVDMIRRDRGKKFDPRLTDLFLDNIEDFKKILEENPD